MFDEKVGVIVVDMQKDFTEAYNGSLAVPGTDMEFVERVKNATYFLHKSNVPVFATADWHPKNHISFETWPPHCIANTEGAELLIHNFVPKWVFKKGQEIDKDSYSGFGAIGLHDFLGQHKVTTVLIYGLTTDYCVKATALDAVKLGFQTGVITGLCRGVAPETTMEAIEEMKKAGVVLL
jgi:nicotinamidase/pyrazinamidase